MGYYQGVSAVCSYGQFKELPGRGINHYLFPKKNPNVFLQQSDSTFLHTRIQLKI